ncbi:MAG: selenide, water dikinase SelD [Coleofasciculus sp. G1-WW12-02]|uniref:selenide, water dikinase SelD n=1 Tax=Coleofasciculus sp. G1-WW12-02 TaxID=3068483 RepID=UPI0032FA8623
MTKDKGQRTKDKDLVLIGGGHSHAIALRMLGMNPLPGVRLTLITNVSYTPYSGMLPGHVAGFYTFDECHIDLRRLAQFAGAQLYIDKAVGLDLNSNKVICANRPPVAFDVLSIDIGSTPAKESIPGVANYAIPAKPVPQFLTRWNQIIETISQHPQQSLSLGIVGGGAGGVELAMTMQRRINDVETRYSTSVKIHLFHRGKQLLPGHNSWVQRYVQKLLKKRGIQVHLGETVSQILPDKICCESGLVVDCDYSFWVTQAAAPSWIAESGIHTNSKGFISVSDTLQSLSHPHIFAAGDIATMVNHPRPKAGVFAVRQGKPLVGNLRRFLQGKALNPYQPQRRYLSLIGTGDGGAIASWGSFGWHSRLLWRWKDHIDRKFMRQFRDLPAMTPGKNLPDKTQNLTKSTLLKKPENTPPMYCAGCGSKVGSTTLERVLKRLQDEYPFPTPEDIILGLGTPDDAAVIKVPADKLLVQTIDYFRTLINDPFIFGQISTHHCLSDLFAMGATPQSVLAMVTVPYGTAEKQEETLYQLLSGAMKVLSQVQAPLVGGHTTEGAELTFGLSCNGLVYPQQILKKSGMKPGDQLILTKGLGTGILFAAHKRLQAKGRWIDQAVESMLLSNQEAVKVFRDHGVTACTDVTGFGCVGHLVEMVQASGVAVELEWDKIPILEGVTELVEQGIVSSLYPQNVQAARFISNQEEICDRANYPVLFDPQTSGGLLATIPEDQAVNCEKVLQELGYKQSCIIGQVISASSGAPPLRFL